MLAVIIQMVHPTDQPHLYFVTLTGTRYGERGDDKLVRISKKFAVGGEIKGSGLGRNDLTEYPFRVHMEERISGHGCRIPGDRYYLDFLGQKDVVCSAVKCHCNVK